MIEPYYSEDGITLYCARCEDVLPHIAATVLITDPPYPSFLTEEYGYHDGILEKFRNWDIHQVIFWTVTKEFPLNFTARHLWDKITGTYANKEYIYERNGGKEEYVFRYQKIGNIIDAQMNRDMLTGHPSQKPIRLMKDIIRRFAKPGDIVIDPYMGTGATALAAKHLGRKCIGIEISERYCEIAVNRLRQKELFGIDMT